MFGLMSKRRFKREVADAAKAYRWERDEALAKAAASEKKYRDLLGALFPHAWVVPRQIGEPRARKRIVIEVDDYVFGGRFTSPDWEYIAKKIILDLQRVQRDARPDMREVMPQGIGGPELPSRMPL